MADETSPMAEALSMLNSTLEEVHRQSERLMAFLRRTHRGPFSALLAARLVVTELEADCRAQGVDLEMVDRVLLMRQVRSPEGTA